MPKASARRYRSRSCTATATSPDLPPNCCSVRINSYPLVIEAACGGHGVALGWRHLVDELIDSGRLLRPLGQSLATDFGYYLIYRDRALEQGAVAKFRDWLLGYFPAN